MICPRSASERSWCTYTHMDSRSDPHVQHSQSQALRRDDPWHGSPRTSDGREPCPGTALLVYGGTHWARWHGTKRAIGWQTGVKVDDHITMHRLGLLEQALDTLRHSMTVFQIPVAGQRQVKIDMVARS